IKVHLEKTDLDTGLIKFGAILGDHCEVGCNSVLNPGCIVGKNTIIYPLSNVRGVIDPDMIYKTPYDICEKN
nr:UDP-N-acetylglucosamine pyrophosphorylase [Lachnospiraceae bacterium]